MQPLVSVVIPTYNSARFLGEAIESVLDQDYPRVETIVIDDGSTDDTPSVLARYGDRIRVLGGKNEGVARARNRGIEAARGDLIAFLDADDAMLPGKLEDQVEVFDGSRRAGMVHSGWLLVDEAGTVIGERRPWEDASKLDLEAWMMWKFVLPGALMIRRSWLERVGGFDPGYGGAGPSYQVEDLHLVLRLAREGCRGVWLRRPTVAYRQHGNSAMRNAPVQAEGVVRVMEDFYAKKGLPRSIRKLEPAVQYYTSIWAAWYVHRHGFDEPAVEHLRRARAALPGGRRRWLVHRWFAQFNRLAAAEGCDRDVLLGTLPLLRRASGLSRERWREIEQVLTCWAEVWSSYVEDPSADPASRHEIFAGRSYEELFQVALHTILVSWEPIRSAAIDRFWKDLIEQVPPPPSRRHDVALLHLGCCAQHIWNHRWRRTLPALLWAVRRGWHPGALYVWRRFFRAAWVHYVLRDRPAMGALEG